MTTLMSTTLEELKFHDKVDQEGLHLVSIPEIVKDDRKLNVTAADLTVSEPITIEKIKEKVAIYGGAIVRNFIAEEDCDQMLADLRPYIDAQGVTDDLQNFLPPTTARVGRTVLKSKTIAEKFLAHPTNLAVANEFLGRENAFRIGPDQIVTGTSEAQLNSCMAFAVRPGAEDQPLHRDDVIHHNIRRKMETYEFGTETAIGTVLALKRTTKENGATRFIPGSHLWDHYREPSDENAFYAELEKGDAFFMLASCYHGGSANITKDEERVIIILFMTQGTLRQEEMVLLGADLDYLRSLSVEALKAMGLQLSQPFCGHVDNIDAIEYLLPESDYRRPHFKESYKVTA
ncbi:unnamed protein product [Kuraishia capsulata CBS 1993]|uniref:Phytanoyl-CoA dioxygenase n=1 Tax=Kuraishia capsulata CBS 1993 TaxID=1382522 RepID=W6MQ86_9ASCO|nr:uncharacterized protein KUCA_T00000015001 [Kuraishia capsulata CBS 1993]CDK24055.1 unnamed protein product [Kuraishia capsulata CBS 1993]